MKTIIIENGKISTRHVMSFEELKENVLFLISGYNLTNKERKKAIELVETMSYSELKNSRTGILLFC